METLYLNFRGSLKRIEMPTLIESHVLSLLEIIHFFFLPYFLLKYQIIQSDHIDLAITDSEDNTT